MQTQIVPLDSSHVRLFRDFYAVSNSPSDYFHKYLVQSSLAEQKQGKARTYLLLQNEEDILQLIGFYSLRASSLVIEEDDFQKTGEPAIEIYELAVHGKLHHNGYGEQLLFDAIARILEASQQVGVRYIVVCAKNDAVSFYEKYGFEVIPGHKEIPRGTNNRQCVPMSVPLQPKD